MQTVMSPLVKMCDVILGGRTIRAKLGGVSVPLQHCGRECRTSAPAFVLHYARHFAPLLTGYRPRPSLQRQVSISHRLLNDQRRINLLEAQFHH